MVVLAVTVAIDFFVLEGNGTPKAQNMTASTSSGAGLRYNFRIK